jgi:hypothetical protein
MAKLHVYMYLRSCTQSGDAAAPAHCWTGLCMKLWVKSDFLFDSANRNPRPQLQPSRPTAKITECFYETVQSSATIIGFGVYCFHPISTNKAHQQPEAHPQTMKLDTVMQIVFGILSALIAVFGIWLAWRYRGKRSRRCVSCKGSALLFQIVWPTHSRLTPFQPETCRRNARTNLYSPLTTITHRPKANISRIRLCIILLDSLPGTAAHTCL